MLKIKVDEVKLVIMRGVKFLEDIIIKNQKEEKIKKQLLAITAIIFLTIIVLYELFYCNFQYFSKEITEYNFSFFRIIAYITVGILLYKFRNYFINEAIKDWDNKIKEMVLYIVVEFSVFLLAGILFITISQKVITIRIILLLITIMLLNLFVIYVSKNMAKNLIIMCLTFGTIFSLSITFNNQLDEKRHFLSSYSIATGNIDMSNTVINNNLQNMKRIVELEEFIEYFNIKPSNEKSKSTTTDLRDLPCDYLTVSHFISAIGIFIAKTLGGSIADIYITGRIFNLLGYCALTVLAIKILPYKKNIFLSIFFMPMLLALASVYSPDGIATALATIFIAYCLKLKEKKEDINAKEITILLILTILACTIKTIGYVGIAIVLLILPWKKMYQNNRRYFRYIFIIILIAFLILGLKLYKIANSPGDTRVSNTDTKLQLMYLIENPLEYIKTFLRYTRFTFTNMRSMSFLNAPMFFTTTYYNNFKLIMIYLLIISVIDRSKNFSMKERIIFLFTFLFIYATISTAMYLSYTPVRGHTIIGYQMRYFFPTLGLLLMILSIKRKSEKNISENNNLYINYPIKCL